MNTRPCRYELFGLLAFTVTIAGCIHTPSGASQQSTAAVTFRGATSEHYDHVELYLRDRRGTLVGDVPLETLLPVDASTSSQVSLNGLYDLSVTIPTSALPNSVWIPQVTEEGRDQGGLRHSVGRLEIVARPPGKANLMTFSQAALSCVLKAPNQMVALACSDGDSFLVYDNDGVDVEGPAAGFIQIADSPFTLSGLADGVALEIGTYGVPGLAQPVNAIVCRPNRWVPPPGLRTVVLNHPGFDLNVGALNACVNWARAGWLAALSAYRYEAVTAAGSELYTYPDRIERPATPDYLPEHCLGEVTDTLRWLDIVRARRDTDDSQILMWGYSHGACVTLRSLEQGAKVKAAVAVSAPTEFFAWNSILTFTNPWLAAGVHTLLLGGTPGALPDAYRARSAARMAVDLKRRSDVRLLQIAVQRDYVVHPSQGCLMANEIGAENHLMRADGEYLTSTETPAGIDFLGCNDLTWTGGAPVDWNKRAIFLLYLNLSDDGHYVYKLSTPPPPGRDWDIPYNKAIRDFLQASFP